MSKQSFPHKVFKVQSQKVNTLMECGHVANGIDRFGHPLCIICIGIDNGSTTVVSTLPNLSNRKATCGDCGKVVDSSLGLVFFEHRPKRETDTYYCGCCGWD